MSFFCENFPAFTFAVIRNANSWLNTTKLRCELEDSRNQQFEVSSEMLGLFLALLYFAFRTQAAATSGIRTALRGEHTKLLS